MRKLLLRFFLFLVFFTTISFLINLIPLANESNGNDIIGIKLDYLSSNSGYNTIFVGSSRTFRQINPAVFDSVASKGHYGIKSFNLGAPATFFPECFDILKRIPNYDKLKYIFIELQPIAKIAKSNMFVLKSYYYLNLNYIGFVAQYLRDSDLPFIDKIHFFSSYFLSYTNKIFVGKYMSYLNRNSAGSFNLGRKTDGFYSLDEYVYQFPNNSAEALSKRDDLLRDTMKLEERKRSSLRIYNSKKVRNNEYLTGYFKSLINEYEMSGIKIFFIIPPRLSNSTYEELHGLTSDAEINERIIDLGNPEIYPEFYLMKYSFDVGHLNKAGSDIYSKIIAEKFLRLNALK